MYKNVVGWCPICNQGWIRIVVDDDSNQLFCCCSECENEWNDPFNLNIKNSNKRFKYGGYHEAYWSDRPLLPQAVRYVSQPQYLFFQKRLSCNLISFW